ncbi:MAG: hypothetical protein Q9222_006602 [Ikaeria aurantiellina]
MASKEDKTEVASPCQDAEFHPSISEPPDPTLETSNTQGSPPGTSDQKAGQEALTAALGRLDVTEAQPSKPLLMAERMFASLAVVFQHAIEKHAIDLGGGDWHRRLLQADQAARQGARDVDLLRWIRSVLDQLLLANSDDVAQAATVLANGSRDESWRLPFGQSGLLEFFLLLVTNEDTEEDALAPALRFIGNACADTDVNRELAISPAYVASVLGCITNENLSSISVAVIYNICNDYERAQHAFRTSGLCLALINLLANPNFETGPLYTFIANLLDFSCKATDTPNSTDPLARCPEHSIQVVIELLQEDDAEPSDVLLVVNTVGVFLRQNQQRFQRYFVEQDLVNNLLDAVLRSSPQATPGDVVSGLTGNRPRIGRDPDEEELSLLRGAVVQVLSDISATGVFSNKYTIDSPLVGTLVGWIASSGQQLQICSCLMLGNLARSDLVCQAMVHRLRVHEVTLQLLLDQTNMQVSYAALGFLRNLALPADNKPVIGTQQSVDVISRFWAMDLNPQVQHASVGLLRQLLNGCISNVRWLLESLSSDQDSPAYEKTYLSLLLLLFGRTDDTATKFEIGRTVATICRCISTSSQGLPPESTSAILHRLYGVHADIATPLAVMISQARFPIIRSEGWFALALMARSREGSAAVAEVFSQLELFGILVSTITGQPTNGGPPRSAATAVERPNTGSTSSSSNSNRSEQEREMQAKDRENALVLVNELLRHRGDDISMIRRGILEDLLRGTSQSPEGAQELMERAQSEE